MKGLAKLNNEIRLRNRLSGDELLTQMGYIFLRPTLRSRLRRVLTGPWLGLAEDEDDLIHDSRNFVLSICVALGMDRDASLLRIDDIIDQLQGETHAYRPWLQTESREVERISEGGN